MNAGSYLIRFCHIVLADSERWSDNTSAVLAPGGMTGVYYLRAVTNDVTLDVNDVSEPYTSMLFRKYFKFDLYDVAACVLILLATAIRIVLLALGWPATNSDEATMGLMALHIAYQGEHPVFMYGQNYMGSLEPHLGALFFLLLGPSLFALRLGLVVLDVLFFLVMYRLVRLLYTRGLALFILFLLCFGSAETMLRQLKVLGGAVETMLFGSLLLLIASWLALSAQQRTHLRRGRLTLYLCCGLVMGLGMWSHLLVLPFVGVTLLLLLLFCRSEMRRWGWISLVVGLLIGFSPTIIFDIMHPAQNALGAFLQVHESGGLATTLPFTLWDQLGGLVFISLPMATGYNACNISADPGVWRQHISSCVQVQGLWGIGYLVLFLLAVVFAVRTVRHSYARYRQEHQQGDESDETRRLLVFAVARTMLLLSGALTLLAYFLSPAPALVPVTSARYLVGLTVMLPALIAPLWASVQKVRQARQQNAITPFARLKRYGIASVSVIVVAIIVVNYGIALFAVFQNVPSVQATNQQQTTMVNDLLRTHLTHIYTDYWTCNRVIFQSDERIVCSVLDEQLQNGQNRYPLYQHIVQGDPHAAYVFAVGSPQSAALAHRVSQSQTKYKVTQMDGYIVYQPEA